MKAEELVARLDWAGIGAQLDQEGYAVIPGLLCESQVRDLATLHGSANIVANLLMSFYRHLAPLANRWNDVLDVSHRYPDTLDAFLAQNREAGQIRSRSDLTRLRAGEYQALHQQSDGERVFPLQLVALLSEPGTEFIGGEFVMTEQRPRMQSRPMVLPLRKGDMAIITVARRPHKGTKGWYRVNLKHAIARVRSGERIGLELLFHDSVRLPTAGRGLFDHDGLLTTGASRTPVVPNT